MKGFKCKDSGYCDREGGRRRRERHAREIQKVKVTGPRAPKEVENLGKYVVSRLGGSGSHTTTIPPSSLTSSFVTNSTRSGNHPTKRRKTDYLSLITCSLSDKLWEPWDSISTCSTRTTLLLSLLLFLPRCFSDGLIISHNWWLLCLHLPITLLLVAKRLWSFDFGLFLYGLLES